MKVSDRYRSSLRSSTSDSREGSLRIIAESLARLGQPNTITASSVQTSGTGTSFVTLGSGLGVRIVGQNGTGTSLTFRRVGTTTVFTFANGARVDLPCAANQNEWQVKRTDDSGSQVTLLFLRYGTA
jgi:hypothetical protein